MLRPTPRDPPVTMAIVLRVKVRAPIAMSKDARDHAVS
jgi:hypothetical protein